MDGKKEKISQLCRYSDSIYHDFAVSVHLSDSAMWILYALLDFDNPCTQKELCDTWHFRKQTLHSALKLMETDGYVELFPLSENRRSKQICLTERGRRLARQTVAIIRSAEEKAMENMPAAEYREMMELTHKYYGLLDESVNKAMRDAAVFLAQE